MDAGSDISAEALNAVSKTGGWVRFASIMAFVGAGFLMLSAVMMIVMSFIPTVPEGTQMAGIGALYIVLALAYLYPGVKLGQYASALARFRNALQNGDLETALDAQRAFWKYAGILTLVMIFSYLVLIIFVVATGSDLLQQLMGFQ